MARPLRIEYPGAFYHVISRGNAGEAIFKSNRDHEKYLECLEIATERFSIRIHTYCLMTNHYHLLVETPQPNLSQAIKWINVSYAAYFNRKRRRRGHLFQGRYKAILVEADTYLKHLSRYIHLNPIRANLAKRLDAYPWSSYGAFIDKTPKPAWLETDWLLSLFGKQQKLATRNYQLFVEEVAWDSLENPAKDLIGGLVLGNTDFVNWVKFTFLATPDSTKKYHTQLADFDLQLAPDTVVDVVSETFGCDRESVLTKGRKRNIARDTAIYLARDLTGKSNVFLGQYFGGISGAGITGRYNHVVQQLKTNPRFKIRVNRIKKQLFNT